MVEHQILPADLRKYAHESAWTRGCVAHGARSAQS